jgi:hypothetical protein
MHAVAGAVVQYFPSEAFLFFYVVIILPLHCRAGPEHRCLYTVIHLITLRLCIL